MHIIAGYALTVLTLAIYQGCNVSNNMQAMSLHIIAGYALTVLTLAIYQGCNVSKQPRGMLRDGVTATLVGKPISPILLPEAKPLVQGGPGFRGSPKYSCLAH